MVNLVDFNLSGGRLSYTRDELLQLRSHDITLRRPTRKAIFSHGLWLPHCYRIPQSQPAERKQSADQLTGTATTRPSPSSTVKFGLLNARSIGQKAANVASVICEELYDVFLITETRHTATEDASLSRCVPDGFVCIDHPRPVLPDSSSTSNHGGVAAIISDRFRCKRLPPPATAKSFESVCFSLTGSSSTIILLLLYRPGSAAVTDTFFTELTSFLEVLALYKCQIVIAGDFNIRVEKAENADASRLRELIDSFGCTQHVPAVPTHQAGGTLDLVITKSDQVIDELSVEPPNIISDHSLISWCISLDRLPPITMNREVRDWNKLDIESFREALLQSELCDVTSRPASANELFHTYHEVLQRLSDQFVPVRKVTIRRQHLAVWMDADCRQLRRKSRMLERRYKRSRQSSDRQKWIEHERVRHRIYRQKEQAYWSTKIAQHGNQPRKLWQTFNNLLGRNTHMRTGSEQPTAQQLLDYFNEKVASVRNSTGHSAPTTVLPPATAVLDQFDEYSTEDVRDVIVSGTTKSCELDPIPTTILKQFLPELLPYLTAMCNTSLQQGCLPESQRRAIITPRLKKSNLDPADVKNYRPISNLTFISKIVERLVCRRLVAYLNEHNFFPTLQSAYRKFHSTETSVLKLVCDALLAADRGEVTLLGFLDLSAAFDTVDH